MKKFQEILESLENEVCERLQEYENGNDVVWNMEEEDYSLTEVEFDTDIFDYVSGEWLENWIGNYCLNYGIEKHNNAGLLSYELTDEDTLMLYVAK